MFVNGLDCSGSSPDAGSRHGVALIPKRILLSVIEAADATVDSLHLTQQGHDRMAAVVWALLEPAIREAAGQAERGDGAASNSSRAVWGAR